MNTYFNGTLKKLLSTELASVAINLSKSWYIITVFDSNSGSIHKRPAQSGNCLCMHLAELINLSVEKEREKRKKKREGRIEKKKKKKRKKKKKKKKKEKKKNKKKNENEKKKEKNKKEKKWPDEKASN